MKESFTPHENVTIVVELVNKSTGDPLGGLIDVKVKIVNPDDTTLMNNIPMIESSQLAGVYKCIVDKTEFSQTGLYLFEITTNSLDVKTIRGSFYREPFAYFGLSGIGGAGAKEVAIEVNDTTDRPLEGVEVWITTDFNGDHVVAGTLITDTTGIVTFTLDPGQYYLWRQHSSVNFPNPKVINVT